MTNIAAYKFAPLENLKELRARLTTLCKENGLKGTILLSPEGINLFVAAPRPAIDELLVELRNIEGLSDLQPKYSESTEQPFHRMLVRIKKEIIAFGVEGIEPARKTSPRLDPRTLKQWLDEGRPVTLLDTRNDYEVVLGTFKGAVPIGINHFRDFPSAVRQLPESMKDQPIVTFCTGGIRCEKAAPFMESEGFRQIWQLDGGILKYFEECGGEHYDGECFVFDQRVGVDPALRETDSAQCFACQTPLTAEQQQDSRFAAGVSCPYCYKTTEEQQAENLAQRHQALLLAATPLPGSAPYDQVRPLNVPASFDRATLLDCLCGILPHLSREHWQRECDEGRIVTDARQRIAAHQQVRAGERYLHLQPAKSEPDVNADLRVLHEDEAIVIIHKPAPLPMHPCGRYNRNTLQYLMNTAWRPQKLRAAHRLDANTTGVVVLTRTQHFASLVQPQFERGEVEKRYLARVKGHPTQDTFACDLPVSSEAGHLGSRSVEAQVGLPARTEFRVIERAEDGTALLEVRPLTGRTNQIRVHLWHLGYPICGDAAYLLDRQLGETQTLSISDAPLCLHAWQISFTHPLSRQRVSYEAAPPAWAGCTSKAWAS